MKLNVTIIILAIFVIISSNKIGPCQIQSKKLIAESGLLLNILDIIPIMILVVVEEKGWSYIQKPHSVQKLVTHCNITHGTCVGKKLKGILLAYTCFSSS